MYLEICDSEFDALAKLADYQQSLPSGQYGASCHFVGTMRDFNQGDDVSTMVLDHYPGMTEKQLQKILDSAQAQWDVVELLVIHRVGEIKPDDNIVVCAAWSAHRDEAFQACRFLIEELKHKAPFWKKERLSDRERWVE
jgi:molybdopterin synthase catalytic subunit